MSSFSWYRWVGGVSWRRNGFIPTFPSVFVQNEIQLNRNLNSACRSHFSRADNNYLTYYVLCRFYFNCCFFFFHSFTFCFKGQTSSLFLFYPRRVLEKCISRLFVNLLASLSIWLTEHLTNKFQRKFMKINKLNQKRLSGNAVLNLSQYININSIQTKNLPVN